MKRLIIATLAAALLPLAASAAPAVGDVVGTTPEAATAALKEMGCEVKSFEAEDGKIEAKCADADGKMSEVYIDPATGAITEIKRGED